MDIADITDACKYLPGKLQKLYPACKISVTILSTYVDNISSGIPQLCYDMHSANIKGQVYAGVGTGLVTVFISGLYDSNPQESLMSIHNHVTSISTGVLTNNFASHFASVFADAKANQ